MPDWASMRSLSPHQRRLWIEAQAAQQRRAKRERSARHGIAIRSELLAEYERTSTAGRIDEPAVGWYDDDQPLR
jgi:hypothetical protein